ncbi:MAG: sigma-70 family RNA polymerase sigma factor [Myxococcales bacterium]|jgi:RNA polymerase sigma-70 factor (ECF subfamily)
MRPDTGAVVDVFDGAVRRYLARRVDDPTTVDDLVQDVHERLHRGQATLSEVERIDAWVFRIARSVLVDHYRRSGRRRRRELPLPPGEPDAVRPLAEDGPALEDNGGAREQVASWLPHFIAGLDPIYREALELTELRGLPQAQAARELGIGLSALKSRVQRGRRQVQRAVLACCHLELDARGRVLDYTSRGCACCDG